jgi:hypothetical protein
MYHYLTFKVKNNGLMYFDAKLRFFLKVTK